jgi:2-phospho-L-lactate/phosphoenolpyruvate guanylyltransferase
MLVPADLDALLRVSHTMEAAIAPNRAGDGTNAMYLPLELPIRLAFGAGSYARHRDALACAGFTPGIVIRSGLAMDIDEVPDLDVLRGRQQYEFLGFPERVPA